MKNLLLLLLLANILYFMWSRYVEPPPETGVVKVHESDLGPALEISSTAIPEAATSVGAVLGSGRPDLTAVVGRRSCVTIGPLNEDAAQAALAEYRGEGMRAQVRKRQGEVSVRYRVHIPNIMNRATGEAMLERLRAGRVEAYMEAPNDDTRWISLGLFSEKSGAEKIELQARSLDMPVEVTQLISDTGDYFVDIALPLNDGAGAMIEKHGEEKVFLKEAATCPQGN
jgi:hypothetical protein